MVAKHYNSKKFYDAFDAFHSSPHFVVAEQYESNKLDDGFESNTPLMLSEDEESTKDA